MMKRILTTMTMAAMMSVASFSQSSVVSAGGEATGDGSVSFSVGQTAYMTAANENGSLSQGVQQAYVITEETGIEITQIQLRAFPNPTNDVLNLTIDGGDFKKMTYALYNNTSKLMTKGSINGSETQISMGAYKAGVYFLEVKADGKAVKRFKVVKN
ncbi:MAG: T9SS type A sorting domain-containing protein [Bacteroidales bacterium]|nr:T9SS type A sorting domain-containing protein [Bacteroidales bacterium]